MRARWILLFLTGLCGCSTRATISLVNGDKFDARVLSGDRDEVVVQTPAGTEVAVPRSEISDIDHPGNVAAVYGALYTTNAALGIVALGSTCGNGKSGSGVSCYLPYLSSAAIGASIFAWGMATWWRSTHAAAAGSKNSRVGAVPKPPAPSAFEFSSSASHRAGIWPHTLKR